MAFAHQVAHPDPLFLVTSDHSCDQRQRQRHPPRALPRDLLLYAILPPRSPLGSTLVAHSPRGLRPPLRELREIQRDPRSARPFFPIRSVLREQRVTRNASSTAPTVSPRSRRSSRACARCARRYCLRRRFRACTCSRTEGPSGLRSSRTHCRRTRASRAWARGRISARVAICGLRSSRSITHRRWTWPSCSSPMSFSVRGE
jgi:hypothetical protein